MGHRYVPAATARFDLEAWFHLNVAPGDSVHFVPRHRYDIERFSVRDLHGVTVRGNGAILHATRPPPVSDEPDRDWMRTFELVNCNGWRVLDLIVEGVRPAGADFDTRYEGQHGFSFLGCRDTVACRVQARNTWGDAYYIADAGDRPTENLLLCDPSAWEVGRNGVSTVGAEDVLVHQPWMALINRTAFNFEVHPGSAVRRWEATDALLGHYGLNSMTSTGEGEASQIAFRGLVLPPSKKFNAIVCGPGAETLTGAERQYGPRRDWTIERVVGGMDHEGRPHYLRYLYVDGLRIRHVPYPMETDGSRLV